MRGPSGRAGRTRSSQRAARRESILRPYHVAVLLRQATKSWSWRRPVVQLLMKYGQASRPANVVSIVPGFASMYRARVLPHIDMTAPGLLIEDFNMTFEVHAKQLGRIEFHPSAANAFTQDPNTIRDYTRQVRRWSLGFWQTVRRHGLHPGRFWMALLLHIVELIASSLLLVLTLPLAALSMATGSSFLRPEHLLLGVLLPDFLLTAIPHWSFGGRACSCSGWPSPWCGWWTAASAWPRCGRPGRAGPAAPGPVRRGGCRSPGPGAAFNWQRPGRRASCTAQAGWLSSCDDTN
ncbi:N-glycosyltransferase [Arthrobacter saudimassiliensis]|uniref:N-glycosyltransferase n=1 Tax=Arthrobacter saudimassiliensis TaxID=1461584 RepID=A0A078MT91_9MICC|nr:N-glycosyltransferase [Arthrobacter saudimassiliensis]